MRLLSRFQKQVDVTLGLKKYLKEAGEICHVMGIPVEGHPEIQIEKTARAIREVLDLSCVVVNHAHGAAAATRDAAATFAGPFVSNRKSARERAIILTPGFVWAGCWGSPLKKASAPDAERAGIMSALQLVRPRTSWPNS